MGDVVSALSSTPSPAVGSASKRAGRRFLGVGGASALGPPTVVRTSTMFSMSSEVLCVGSQAGRVGAALALEPETADGTERWCYGVKLRG